MITIAEQDILKIVAESAAKTAIKMLKDEERKGKKKRAFQNTNLLLEHYLELKDFCNNVVYESAPMAVDDENYRIFEIIDEVTGETVSVRSLKRSKEVTLIMLNHIDAALEVLKEKCELSNKDDMMDKYTVIDMLHLNPALQELDWIDRLGTVSDELGKSEKTIRRWRNEMVNTLGIYIFGAEGLNLLT
ncbi:MAG: hypothetical protein ACK5MV_07545 [Aminipila sp.]